jgi:hypothetical protein
MAWKECTMEQLHFRTDRVAPAQRFASWRQTLFDTYYRLDCHADDTRMPSTPFRGVLESRINGGVRCSRIASSPNRVVRTHGQVRGGEADELGLLVIAGGTLTVDHCGRHDLLQPGDLLAFDNARDYVFDLRSDYDLLCFQLPRELLPQRGSPFERHLGARLPGRLEPELGPHAVDVLLEDVGVGRQLAAGDVVGEDVHHRSEPQRRGARDGGRGLVLEEPAQWCARRRPWPRARGTT